ncbi:MAG: ATP-binding protein, partial [Candidatus Altiarchaeota archaeon]
MRLPEIESTREIFVPTDPIERVIGQKTAVEKVKLAIIQRRHLLLVGPPGIGKSMLAQALALHLRKPKFQVSILPNPTNSHKPVVEVLTREELERERNTISTGFGQMLTPKDVPSFVAERLGFRCTLCGELSDYKERICPKCGANKYSRIMPEGRQSPFTDIITDVFDVQGGTPEPEIQTTHIRKDGVEELVIYQRLENQRIRILNQDAIVEMQKLRDKRIKNVIVPVDRSTFVHATGASETELLGDVRHDPYGSHPEIGTPAYLRVVPGAIHEAHEG